MKLFYMAIVLTTFLQICSRAAIADICIDTLHGHDRFAEILEKGEALPELLVLPQPQHLENKLAELGIQDIELKQIFEQAMQLRPVFDHQIVYSHIVFEAMNQVGANKGKVRTLLGKFSVFSRQEKEDFISDILNTIAWNEPHQVAMNTYADSFRYSSQELDGARQHIQLLDSVNSIDQKT